MVAAVLKHAFVQSHGMYGWLQPVPRFHRSFLDRSDVTSAAAKKYAVAYYPPSR